MSISLGVGASSFPIGSGEFFNSFFSTVATRLEGGDWGSRFPVLMKRLYQGRMEAVEADSALIELTQIAEEFQQLPRTDAVWDATDLSQQAPWGDDVAPTITSLANYLWTSDGRDLIAVLDRALRLAQTGGNPVVIE